MSEIEEDAIAVGVGARGNAATRMSADRNKRNDILRSAIGLFMEEKSASALFPLFIP